MSDVKRLLDEATPLPWRIGQDPFDRVYGPDGRAITDDCCTNGADAALIVHAVNRLPDYEAAVDALTALEPWLHRGYTLLSTNPAVQDQDPTPLQDAALDALRRLRDEVPA